MQTMIIKPVNYSGVDMHVVIGTYTLDELCALEGSMLFFLAVDCNNKPISADSIDAVHYIVFSPISRMHIPVKNRQVVNDILYLATQNYIKDPPKSSRIQKVINDEELI